MVRTTWQKLCLKATETFGKWSLTIERLSRALEGSSIEVEREIGVGVRRPSSPGLAPALLWDWSELWPQFPSLDYQDFELPKGLYDSTFLELENDSK